MTTITETPIRQAGLDALPQLDVAAVGRKAGALVLAALPGVLTVYLSFNSGGYFAGSEGAVAGVLALVLALRTVFVRDPFGGFSRPLLIAVGGLGIYSIWCLLSSHWSHSSSRALLDFDLANIYLLALVLFGSSARSHRRVRWTVGLTWLSMLAVCLAALATRLRPDLFPIPANLSPNRLAFPLTYWNALGVFAVIGITLTMHLASSTREPRAIRVLATLVLPIFAITILLTFSRAALALGAGSLLVYALLARPRGLLSALLAAGPPTAFAITSTYDAKLIANASTSAAAVQQGRHLTVVLLGACLAAGLIRIALLELDARLARATMPHRAHQTFRAAFALLSLAAVLVAFIGFGHQISSQWNSFVKQDSSVGINDVRNRITAFHIGGRLPTWRIAIKTFDSSPLHGEGAGTFAIDWYRSRPNAGTALETHSLYLEAMSELGLVGISAIVITILTLIAACFVRTRRTSRSLWTALGVIGLAWAIHAAVDWDWEMPAVTLPVIALTACALGRRGGGTRLRPRVELALRLIVCVIAIALAVTGIQISVSDSHLNSSVAAFNNGNCGAAVADANASLAAVTSRPQPYAIIGYCDVLSGRDIAGVQSMQAALTRDPQNWRYLYGLAVAKAAAGQDPLPALGSAAALDPLEPMIQTARTALGRLRPALWRQVAPSVAMPVSMRQ